MENIMTEKFENKDSSLTLKNRKELSVSGVYAILELNDTYTTLDTEQGRLNIEGEGIKIEGFDKESRVINLSGKIESLFYTKAKLKAKSLFYKKQ